MSTLEAEPSANPLTNDGREPTILPWQEGRQRIADARYYWLSTTHSSGRPHVRPVLGVWVGGALCTPQVRTLAKGETSSATAAALSP